MKKDVRKDSSAAQFDDIRLSVTITTGIEAVLEQEYIQGAYLQSGPFKSTIYLRPPKELGMEGIILWKLTKLRYCITEVGRQWEIFFESWLTHGAGIKRVSGVDQIFINPTLTALVLSLWQK